MVQKLRKLFRKWGKSSRNDTSGHGDSGGSGHGTGRVASKRSVPSLSSLGTNQPIHEFLDPLKSPPPDATASSSHSTASDHRSALKWAPMLAKIPKLVQQLVNADENDTELLSGLVHNLVDLLSQMAGKDAQQQILRFYQVYHDRSGPARVFSGGGGGSHSHGHHMGVTSPVSGSRSRGGAWDQKGLFRQCVRSLLSCWKFALLQLNSHLHPTESKDSTGSSSSNGSAPIPDEMVELYHKLVLCIAERVEFSLREDDRAEGSRRTSVTLEDPAPENKEDDLYYYRCLLVGTFKYVVESVQKTQRGSSHSPTIVSLPTPSNSHNNTNTNAGLHRVHYRKKRTLLEMRFDARVLAICFVRVPVIQKAILDQLFDAYNAKTWTKAPRPSPGPSGSCSKQYASLPRSVSCGNNVHRAVGKHTRKSGNDSSARRRVWHGPTFVESLKPWSQYDGHALMGPEELQATAIKVHSWSQGQSHDKSGGSSPSNSSAAHEREGDRPIPHGDSGSSSVSSRSRSSSTSSTSCVEQPASSPLHNAGSADNRFRPVEAVRFELMNPTLFRWTRFSPYLVSYPDTEVFSFLESTTRSLSNCSSPGALGISQGTPPCSPSSNGSSSSLPLVFERLVSDAEFFMFFVAAFYCHVEKMAQGSTIVWAALPGYSLLVRTALLLVREAAWKQWKDLQEYVDPTTSIDETERFGLSKRGVKTVLCEAAHLLKHAELLESCVLAMFECTNVYDPRSVGLCLGQLEQWFVAVAVEDLRHESFRLPTCFKGRAFAIGIRIMLSSVSFEILNRVLLFLYNQMELFDGELRHSVLKALVHRHVFLFLHWNADVRNQYHHLLVYRISRVDRFALHSFVDTLLVGHHAQTFAMDSGFDDSSDGDSNDCNNLSINLANASACNNNSSSSNNNSNAMPSNNNNDLDDDLDDDQEPFLYDQGLVRMEQALWRAFDACTAAICVEERAQAREASRKFQFELDTAHNRAKAFRHLSKQIHEDASTANANVNEVLPGARPSHEVELLDFELHREPPYYLRYLPPEEVALLEELQGLAQTIRYPAELQVYASHALRNYADLLKRYYAELRENGVVQPPPLGFC